MRECILGNTDENLSKFFYNKHAPPYLFVYKNHILSKILKIKTKIKIDTFRKIISSSLMFQIQDVSSVLFK